MCAQGMFSVTFGRNQLLPFATHSTRPDCAHRPQYARAASFHVEVVCNALTISSPGISESHVTPSITCPIRKPYVSISSVVARHSDARLNGKGATVSAPNNTIR